jgi:two-component system, chemotaxis family, protein-glutamate methylesterase/glutaminase
VTRGSDRFVAIGCSLGGFRAVATLLGGLPRDFPAPIAIVQHRAVQEAEDKQLARPGNVYVAPAGYHLLVDDGAFALSVDDPVNFARPSIDVMFESLAEDVGEGAIAVVLSGASRDGSAGALKIRTAGGYVLVQDPAEAECSVLPQAALETMRSASLGTTFVLPLAEIAQQLMRLLVKNPR